MMSVRNFITPPGLCRYTKIPSQIDPNLSEEETKKLKFERNTKAGGFVIIAIIVGGTVTFCVYNGRPHIMEWRFTECTSIMFSTCEEG